MKNSRMQRAGSALAVLLSLELIAACEDPDMEKPAATPPGQAPMVQPRGDDGPPRAYEQPGQTPPGQAPMVQPRRDAGPPAAHEQPGQPPAGQAPMAEPLQPPAEDTDH